MVLRWTYWIEYKILKHVEMYVETIENGEKWQKTQFGIEKSLWHGIILILVM